MDNKQSPCLPGASFEKYAYSARKQEKLQGPAKNLAKLAKYDLCINKNGPERLLLIDRIIMIDSLKSRYLWKAALSIAAILGIVGCRAITHIFIPSSHLRGIPKVPTLSFLLSILKGNPFEESCKKIIWPIIEKKGMASVWFLGRWGVFLSDPSDIKYFLSHTSDIPKVTTPKQSQFLINFFGKENVANSNGEEWRHHRKILDPAFRHTIPTQCFGECAHELFEYINLAISQGVDVEIPLVMRRLTLDALGRGLFNFNFNALQDPYNEYCKKYDGALKGMTNPFRLLFPSAEPLIALFDRQSSQSLDELNKLFLGIIENRKKEIHQGLDENINVQHKNLLDLMIDASIADVERNWTATEIKNNLMVFFFAGHETTQAALSVSIYFLALHPEIQEIARQEVDRILANSDRMQIPSVESCRSMKYIDCIIKESLRIYPPAPGIGPRVVENSVEIGGVMLPKGTYIIADVYTLHNSTKYWQDPEKFWPDRFLSENHPPRDAWMPFGGGPRICVSF
ncbi:uncharacterized protein VTP21DRAFT_2269 [Calcarisporiella thermophila]|uniref:uncharacterized protein n=1 Tax=Calcarisporiella thermophila TaxID=911321 RepID=UPI00374390A3